MDFANTYGLLVAVSAPVSVVLGMNVWLYLRGERGTLLLPTSEGWPSLRLEAAAAVEPAPAAAPASAAANDEPYRLAA
ncbi:MAG TPA: hypothetical protein VMG61_05235 [Usitatibacter sp.]|nr:hypothetical protein [Usitatibacter sp.]